MKNNFQVYYPKDKDVLNFIKNHNENFNGKLTKYFNYSRVVALSDFCKQISKMNLNNFSKVAVVSGSTEDPELRLINYTDLDILDFEEKSNFYNLDDDWTISKFYKNKKSQYDLVLCNQVFEHIFSPIQGIKNIWYLIKKNGYAWISVPTINCIHGEPYFYSAGYHPRYLNRLCDDVGFEVLHIGAFGNRKYLAYAVQGYWSNYTELKIGFRSKFDLAHPYFAIQDGKKNDTSGNIITDTWALLRKK